MFFPFIDHDVLRHLRARGCVRDLAIGRVEVEVDIVLHYGHVESPHTVVLCFRVLLAVEPVAWSIQSMCHESQ